MEGNHSKLSYSHYPSLTISTSVIRSPQLPLGQILLMVYAWLSMLLYAILIYILLRSRREFSALRSSYYTLFLLQAVGDFYMFLTVELVMRPRKFNYFNLFSENMHGFATFSYINLIIAKTVICTGHIFISLNRFTAFYRPSAQNRIWSRTAIIACAATTWTIAGCSAIPFLMVDSYSINFHLQPSGILQMFGQGLAVRYDTVQSAVVNAIVVLLCSIFYTLSLKYARKSISKRTVVERRLLICALASSFPFSIEFIRSALGLYFSMDGMSYPYMITTEFWFYEVEVVVSASVWLQLIINRNLRLLIFRRLFGCPLKGMGVAASTSNLTF